MKLFAFAFFLASALLSGACSTVDKYNPFSSVPSKNKPAELVDFKADADIVKAWQASVGSAGEYSFSPAVVGRSVYAASRDGNVARFEDGSQQWRINTKQSLSGGVGSDGKLVVVGTEKGEVLAFDTADGRLVWKARVSSEVLAAPAIADGLVVIRSGDSRVFGFNVGDGSRRWVYQRSTPALSLRSSAGVLMLGNLTLAGFPGGKLVAISNNNGAALWEITIALPKGSTELERVADITSSPVVSGSTVCAAAFQGRVSCFDGNTGSTLWSREMSSSKGLDMDDRNIYVADDKGAVHAMDRTSGASVWKQDKLFMRGLSRPIALGSHVAVGDASGVVHLLRRQDGALAARTTTDGSAVRVDPQHLGDGFLLQTANGGLYALQVR